MSVQQPLISIITPVYRAASTLERCILSVATQSADIVEHILVDGGSDDGSVEMMAQFSNKFAHIRWISEADRGIYDAMNKGIAMARGQWLHFLGADDTLMPNAMDQLLRGDFLQEYDLVYGHIYNDLHQRPGGEEFTIEKLLLRPMCHQGMLFHRRVFEQLGCYDISYRIAADWLFNLRCFLEPSLRIKYIPELMIASYSDTGFSARPENRLRFLEEKCRLLKTLHLKLSALQQQHAIASIMVAYTQVFLRADISLQLWWQNIRSVAPVKIIFYKLIMKGTLWNLIDAEKSFLQISKGNITRGFFMAMICVIKKPSQTLYIMRNALYWSKNILWNTKQNPV